MLIHQGTPPPQMFILYRLGELKGFSSENVDSGGSSWWSLRRISCSQRLRMCRSRADDKWTQSCDALFGGIRKAIFEGTVMGLKLVML